MLYIKAVLLLCVSLLCFSNSEGNVALYDGYHYYSSLQAQLKLHREPADWQTARIKCHNEGAILAAPWSDHIWSLLLLYVTLPDDLTIYAGVQEHFPEGIYKNVNGKQVLSRNLQDTLDLARCVVYHSNGTRELVDCKLPFAFVCQAPVAETLGCGGLDYELDSRTGSCYKFHDTCKTWDDAYKTCQDEGAYLAIINSATEADVLKEMLANHPWKELTSIDDEVKFISIAVGFYYWKEVDTYVTIHGESLEQTGYVNWCSNPAPSRNLSGAGGVMYLEGLLGDTDKSRRLPFICEKKPVLRQNEISTY